MVKVHCFVASDHVSEYITLRKINRSKFSSNVLLYGVQINFEEFTRHNRGSLILYAPIDDFEF